MKKWNTKPKAFFKQYSIYEFAFFAMLTCIILLLVFILISL